MTADNPRRVPRDLEERIYARACEAGSVTVSGIAAETEASPAEILTALQRLCTLRLVRETEHGEGRFVAVSPESAKLQHLTPLLGELRRLQRRAETMLSAYDDFVHVYETTAVTRLRRAAVEVIPGRGDVRRTIDGLAAASITEVLMSHPGGPRPRDALRESLTRSCELLTRGVALRTLYQHSAQFDGGTTAFVERTTALGAEFRTLAGGFPHLMVFDRRRALIPSGDGSDGATLVGDPGVVDFAVAAFERAWVAGVPFRIVYDQAEVREASENIRHSIMRLLVVGEGDRHIAGHLGMSLRSCQRHVAQIMKRIGARNRLHAGYLIAQHDLLNRPLPENPRELASAPLRRRPSVPGAQAPSPG